MTSQTPEDVKLEQGAQTPRLPLKPPARRIKMRAPTCPETEWRTGSRLEDLSDPTSRTMATLNGVTNTFERELAMRAETRQREHSSLQELIETRMLDSDLLSTERVASIRREIGINEAHRLELKSDSEKTLNTATIAAEKAVQAALAAAEKARDQQTIASQLATTKAEEASKEQMKQQGETFTTAISGLNTGFNDVKSMLGELRAERRGGQETQHDQRANQNDQRAGNQQLIAFVGLLLVLVTIVMPFIRT